MPRMTIQRLPPERWEEYRAIRLEALRVEPSAFGSTYEGMAAKPDSYWIGRLEASAKDPTSPMLFAFMEASCVGMVAASPAELPGIANLISMYVSPGVRGQGVGRSLAVSLIEELQALGTIAEVQLLVNDSQIAAKSLYLAVGFQEVAAEELARPDGSRYIQRTMSLTL